MNRHQLPPITIGLILALAATACVEGATEVSGSSVTQDPVSIFTTTVTSAPAGPGTSPEPAPNPTTVTSSTSAPTIPNGPGASVPNGPGVNSRAGAAIPSPTTTTTERPDPSHPPAADIAARFAPRPEEISFPKSSESSPLTVDDPMDYWRPDLQDEAFEAIDPWASGAALWYEEEYSINTAPHRFYRFYYMEGDQQTEMWRRWRRTLAVFLAPPVIYYPVRYDLSWHDYPDTVKVVATWPMGEQRELLVADGEPLAEIELPTSPPLPPTTPFAEPQFPETATLLGRDCPPMEAIWLLDAPVEDPCTLAAVRTAFQFAHAAATPRQTQAAVRDGHVLAETVAQIRDIANQDSFFAHWFDPANPGHYLAEVRNVRWAGRFPGASRISAEFRLYARPGLASPRMQELARQKIQEQVEAGLDVPEWALGDQLPTGPPPPDVGFWEEMMVVRTADGTWRMSYPMWCFSMQAITLFESVSCPDDPNPVWSDSIWDFDLYPPNHLDFWLNATSAQRRYLGVPSS